MKRSCAALVLLSIVMASACETGRDGGQADGGAAGDNAKPALSAADGSLPAPPETPTTKPSPRGKRASLSAGERRVPVFILPGDASVEVDGKPTRRRSGVIELVGPLGKKYNFRVSKGDKAGEVTISINQDGASQSHVNLEDLRPAARRQPAPVSRAVWQATNPYE